MRSNLVLLAIFCVGALSCIGTPGRPWGAADVSLDALFAPDAARIDHEGRLVTAKDYAVALDDVSVRFGDLFLAQISDGISFDPANPPPGFTLCHNGECHRENGDIVSFAEVEAELSGGALQGLHVDVADADRVLTDTPVVLPTSCGRCVLDRGTIAFAQLELVSTRVVATAFDRRAVSRIPSEKLPFDLTIPIDAPVVAPIGIDVERFEPIEVALHFRFSLGAALLDAIDFSAPLNTADSAATIVDGSTLSLLEITP